MMRILLALLLTLFVVPAHAADAKPDPALCRAAAAYQPSADADYKPGVDVHGHYVAPADLNAGASLQLPKKINIPLTVSLAKSLNFDTTQYPYNQLGTGTEAVIGTISVEGNNVTLDGKPLNSEQQGNLAALCNQSKQ